MQEQNKPLSPEEILIFGSSEEGSNRNPHLTEKPLSEPDSPEVKNDSGSKKRNRVVTFAPNTEFFSHKELKQPEKNSDEQLGILLMLDSLLKIVSDELKKFDQKKPSIKDGLDYHYYYSVFSLYLNLEGIKKSKNMENVTLEKIKDRFDEWKLSTQPQANRKTNLEICLLYAKSAKKNHFCFSCGDDTVTKRGLIGEIESLGEHNLFFLALLEKQPKSLDF